MINHCSKPINPTYLLGLNCADTADNVGCEVVGFWLVYISVMAVSSPLRRIGPFPSLRIIPGPSLPSVSDGAHTSKGRGPGRLLERT